MAKRGDHISPERAAQVIAEWFNGTTSNFLTIQELYHILGRENINDRKNRKHISDRLTDLKYFGLVVPEYEWDGKIKRLAGVKLTVKGKKILDRAEQVEINIPTKLSSPQMSDQTVSLDWIVDSINTWNETHPQSYFHYELRPKENKKEAV